MSEHASPSDSSPDAVIVQPRPQPGRVPDSARARDPERPAFLVDLRRCIGCHACSVACKTAHGLPLGVFALRVRWLARPEGGTWAFVPVFSESTCSGDPESLEVGFDPACVRACPTEALKFGDLDAPADPVFSLIDALEAQPLSGPELEDAKNDVYYVASEDWMGEPLHRGVALDPRDRDPIYEQE